MNMRFLLGIMTFLLFSVTISAQKDSVMILNNGDLKGYGKVDAHKQLIGNWIYYYSNGNKQSEGVYVNNKPVGVWKNYLKDGSPLNELTYNNKGQKEGHYKKWYYNEKEIWEGNYVNDSILVGLTIRYDFQGNKVIEGYYIDGMREGVWKWYWTNKQLQAIGKFKNDLFSGKWEYFYDNGNQDCEGRFVNGKKEGEWIWYDKELKFIKLRATYLDDKKDGIWTWYDNKGNIISRTEYKADDLIKQIQ